MDPFEIADGFEDVTPACADAVVVADAAAGDRLVRLLAARPRRLALVGRRPAQRHGVELQLAALKGLEHDAYLELAGHRGSARRRVLYQSLRWRLPRETDEYWLARLGLVDRGMSSQGVAERRLAWFRTLVGWIQGARRVARFRSLETEAERRAVYAREWRTRRWRLLGSWLWRRCFDAPPERLERLLLEGRLLAPPPEIGLSVFASAKECAARALVAGSPDDYLRTLPDASVDLVVLGGPDARGLEGEIARVSRPGVPRPQPCGATS